MTESFIERVKNYFKLQILYGKLLFKTGIDPMKSVYDIKYDTKFSSDTQKLEIDITALAYHKSLKLGIEPFNTHSLNELIHAIQIAEGCSPCFKNKPDCSEARCCWMKLCFKES